MAKNNRGLPGFELDRMGLEQEKAARCTMGRDARLARDKSRVCRTAIRAGYSRERANLLSNLLSDELKVNVLYALIDARLSFRVAMELRDKFHELTSKQLESAIKESQVLGIGTCDEVAIEFLHDLLGPALQLKRERKKLRGNKRSG
ncbi:MAG: hypothetical protein LBG75_02955 [Candidatus Nomurabacteria bacterium]|jgi:hypothetical protein|nr:hypothetical protein [Candidatus Nomurabacteria bacterium]